MKPKVLVLRTAGTNCDKESVFAFERSGAEVELRHVNQIRHKNNINGYQMVCIPGGFSYGDDLGAGKILSRELVLWFKDYFRKLIDSGGLIIGICNGFQVLVKTGILPDLDFRQKLTLTLNDSARFEDRWVYLKVAAGMPAGNVWLKDLPEIISLPVAHGEGKFCAVEQELRAIETANLVALRYVDAGGKSAGYPFNPNGSVNHIAGITDKTGRIFGLMPHPERFVFKHHWPNWREKELFPFGLKIFENAVNYFK